VSELQNYLSLDENVLFGYLFGSYAKNKQTPRSDVDVALYLRDTSLDSKLKIHYKLSKLLQKDIDFIVLNEVRNIYLLEDILQSGIVIKDNGKRFDFEIIKEHSILDYKAFRRYIDAA
jgi:predicted nucleotidyltransferase